MQLREFSEWRGSAKASHSTVICTKFTHHSRLCACQHSYFMAYRVIASLLSTSVAIMMRDLVISILVYGAKRPTGCGSASSPVSASSNASNVGNSEARWS